MCGILGQISLGEAACALPPDFFLSALNKMEHRGPDDSGVITDDRFIFGHRRLSILDLSTKARQPMVTPDGALTLSYNGEIYNFKALRKSLQNKGAKFHTTSDTEVLLYGLYYEGIDFIKRCNGFFAFAAYDKRTDCCWIARDRLGIKPLYVHDDGKFLTFSSEIKSILALTKFEAKLNVKSVSSYMSFRYPIGNQTFFEHVECLAPGNYLTIKNGSKKQIQYWDPRDAFDKQSEDKGESYYIEGLKAQLEDAISKRMIADVPVGAYLSGGVDSSLISAVMAMHTDHPLKSFTIGFDEPGYNEFEYASLVAQQYKTDHHEIILNADDYFQKLNTLIEFKDAPLAVPNEVPLYEMSKQLKKHITVVLSGEGADELFGGYGRIFRSTDEFEKAHLAAHSPPDPELAIFQAAFIKKYGVSSFSKSVDHFLQNYRYTSINLKKSLLNLDIDGIEKELVGEFESLFDSLPGQSYLNKALYTFEKLHLQGLLGRVDTTTMATSVEARVPFVDHELVEFAFSIPEHYKMRWKSKADAENARSKLGNDISELYDIPKWILKKSSESLLPEKILYRKKMGFPVPLDKWFGGKFKALAQEILLSRACKERGLINQKSVESLLNKTDGSFDHSMGMKLWMLVNLELFQIKYFDS